MQEGVITPEHHAAHHGWAARLAEVLLCPQRTFTLIREENADRLVGAPGAALLVAFVFALEGICRTPGDGTATACWFLLCSIMFGFCLWFSLSALIAILAITLQRNPQNIRASFVSLGWSFAPWLLMTPMFGYQHFLGGGLSLFAFLAAVWVLALQVIALTKSFELRLWQSALLVFVAPALLSCIQMMQLVHSFYITAASVMGQ